jgi:hypothetical protein
MSESNYPIKQQCFGLDSLANISIFYRTKSIFAKYFYDFSRESFIKDLKIFHPASDFIACYLAFFAYLCRTKPIILIERLLATTDVNTDCCILRHRHPPQTELQR